MNSNIWDTAFDLQTYSGSNNNDNQTQAIVKTQTFLNVIDLALIQKL